MENWKRSCSSSNCTGSWATACPVLDEYTVVVYSGANAYVMAVDVIAANNLGTAQIDLVGVLQGVGTNSMLANNFA